MSLSLDDIKSSISECKGNVLKIRKYIRDNQAQLQSYSTNQLNRLVKEFLPKGMLLKRNYGHLALRSVAKTAPKEDEVEAELPPEPRKESRKSHKPVKKPQPEYEYEYEEEEVYEQPIPQQHFEPRYQPQYEPTVNPYMMTNADIARQCFLPAAQRYRNRTW